MVTKVFLWGGVGGWGVWTGPLPKDFDAEVSPAEAELERAPRFAGPFVPFSSAWHIWEENMQL